MDLKALKAKVRSIPDFPKKGILLNLEINSYKERVSCQNFLSFFGIPS